MPVWYLSTQNATIVLDDINLVIRPRQRIDVESLVERSYLLRRLITNGALVPEAASSELPPPKPTLPDDSHGDGTRWDEIE